MDVLMAIKLKMEFNSNCRMPYTNCLNNVYLQFSVLIYTEKQATVCATMFTHHREQGPEHLRGFAYGIYI